jgi:hypothetical protein
LYKKIRGWSQQSSSSGCKRMWKKAWLDSFA